MKVITISLNFINGESSYIFDDNLCDKQIKAIGFLFETGIIINTEKSFKVTSTNLFPETWANREQVPILIIYDSTTTQLTGKNNDSTFYNLCQPPSYILQKNNEYIFNLISNNNLLLVNTELTFFLLLDI